MMKATRLWWFLGACVALASCATTSVSPYPPLGATQQLVVRTDPAGATCTVLQSGALVASVDSTPGAAIVRRDFCLAPSTPFILWSTPDYCKGPLELIAPIDVTCRKEGYRELRRTFTVAYAAKVQSEESPTSEPTAASWANNALVIGMMVPPAAPFLMPFAIAVAAEQHNQPPTFAYAYRALPTFFLVPATFASEAERDAYFASLEAKLRAERDAQRAFIDKQCRYFPCKPSDPAPCLDPTCQQRRERLDAELESQLMEVPALRAQVRIIAPLE